MRPKVGELKLASGFGTLFSSGAESCPMVAAAANAPVFSLFDVCLNHGEVGGRVSSFAEQGKVVGSMALRMLQGERPQDVPVVTDASVYMFDWRALRRWGFKENDLPPGSIVLNRQPTFWESFRPYIIGAVSLILAEALLISGLLFQRARRKAAGTKLVIANEQLAADLIAHRQTTADLQKSEENFSKAFHLSPEAVALINTKDGRYVDVNETFEHLTGWKRDEVIGRTPSDIGIWVDPTERVRFMEQLVRDKHVRDFEANFCMMNSEVRAGVRSAELIEIHGELCVISMITDVTDRKRTEATLGESEERFRLVANTAPVMIWMAGPDRLCDYTNQSWLDFTGRPIEAELGSGWADGIHPDDVDACLKTYTEAFDQRRPFQMQYRYRRHDREYRWLLDTGVPRFNADASFAGYIGSCIDITEHKLAEDALSTVNRRLIEAHEEERTWIARELHDDVNQRLALLAVSLERTKQAVPASAGTLRQQIDEAYTRVQSLGSDVQALTHRLHPSKLDYLGLVAAAAGFCKELSSRKGVEIDFHSRDMPAELPREISLGLFRVLQEALQNGMKHSGSRRFEVSLNGGPDEIHLAVRDWGIGFNPNDIATRGLGLTSMRERLRLVNGDLLIDSRPQHGTVLYATVPLSTRTKSARA